MKFVRNMSNIKVKPSSLYVWLVIARDDSYHKLAYRRILRNCLVSQDVDTMLDRYTIEMALGASQRSPITAVAVVATTPGATPTTSISTLSIATPPWAAPQFNSLV
uniref:Uncharacterized protein n=1 Tax=Glossina austeni TaxID=7395 RepID=A0A1A9VTJ5_GLOAU